MNVSIPLLVALVFGAAAHAGAQTTVTPKAVVEQRTDSLDAYASKHPKRKVAAKSGTASAKSKTKSKPTVVAAAKSTSQPSGQSVAKSAAKSASSTKRSDKMAFVPSAAKSSGK